MQSITQRAQPTQTEVTRASRRKAKQRELAERSFDCSVRTEARFESTVCTRRFRTEELAYEHLQAHIKGKTFTCDVCSKCYRTRKPLDAHLLVHQGEDALKFDCPLCKKRFKSERLVQHHIFSHCKLNPPTCALCQKPLQDVREIKFHLSEHFGETVSKFRCTKCDSGFPGQYDLNQHIRVCKRGVPYTCDDCYEFFLTEDGLRRHLVIHRKQRKLVKFDCQKCGEICKSMYRLQEHLKQHFNGVRSYCCSECGEGVVMIVRMPGNRSRMVTKELKKHVLAHVSEKLGMRSTDMSV